MNETERALVTLQDLLDNSIFTSRIDLALEVAIEALQDRRLAIDALREKAERVLCAKCKHYNKTGCSAGFGWCENMDRGTHDEFYCASGKRLEVEP